MLGFSFFQNNYNETRVGYDWTGQHVSSYLSLFPSRTMTTITITVIQRKPERFMMKHTNPPQMTLSEFFSLLFLIDFLRSQKTVCFRAVLCVGEERCVTTQNGCEADNRDPGLYENNDHSDRWTFLATNCPLPVWRETLGNTGSLLCRMALWDYFVDVIT